MKETLLTLLKALLALARTPTAEEKSTNAQLQNLEAIKAHIKTFHGDDPLADDDVHELIDDLTTVCQTSEPADEYAEKPHLEDLKIDAPAEESAEEAPAEEVPAEEEAEPAKPIKRKK